jgi:hypothetical protein
MVYISAGGLGVFAILSNKFLTVFQNYQRSENPFIRENINIVCILKIKTKPT